jgi:hypothetical protein
MEKDENDQTNAATVRSATWVYSLLGEGSLSGAEQRTPAQPPSKDGLFGTMFFASKRTIARGVTAKNSNHENTKVRKHEKRP